MLIRYTSHVEKTSKNSLLYRKNIEVRTLFRQELSFQFSVGRTTTTALPGQGKKNRTTNWQSYICALSEKNKTYNIKRTMTIYVLPKERWNNFKSYSRLGFWKLWTPKSATCNKCLTFIWTNTEFLWRNIKTIVHGDRMNWAINNMFKVEYYYNTNMIHNLSLQINYLPSHRYPH